MVNWCREQNIYILKNTNVSDCYYNWYCWHKNLTAGSPRFMKVKEKWREGRQLFLNYHGVLSLPSIPPPPITSQLSCKWEVCTELTPGAISPNFCRSGNPIQTGGKLFPTYYNILLPPPKLYICTSLELIIHLLPPRVSEFSLLPPIFLFFFRFSHLPICNTTQGYRL